MASPVSHQVESGRIVQAVSGDNPIQDALDIPPLRHEEAGHLMAEEAQRLLVLLEALSDEDWNQPTACTLWNVRQLACHLAGESAGYASWREFYRQYLNFPAKRRYRRAGMPLLDALNQQMVDDRAAATPAEIIAEIRNAAPKAIKTRQRLPAALRVVRLPMPALGTVRIDYLTDMIYPRDTWMHRVDIMRAAGRDIVLDAGHDARIVALVVRDLVMHLTPLLEGQSIILELDSAAGGRWHIGENSSPAATIQIALIDFMLLASGRMGWEEAQKRAALHGDVQLGAQVLQQTSVPF